MRAALAQFPATPDKAVNIAAATGLIARAADEGADLVVLPEYAMSWDARATAADLLASSEALDGPFVTALAAAARKHRVAVVAGMTEQPEGDTGTTDRSGSGMDATERLGSGMDTTGQPGSGLGATGRLGSGMDTTGQPGSGALPANTVVAVGPDGALAGAYRKVHLYDAFGDRESDRLAAHAPQALVLDVAGLRVGVMTCYDLRFPEMARFLVDAGADVLAVPATWMAGPGKVTHWEVLARARAIENTAYVLACSQNGQYRTGRSLAVDPSGEVLASLGEETGVAVVELDGAKVQAVRERNPSLANRRFTVAPR